MFVKTNLTDEQVSALAAIAIRKGAAIVDPHKPWALVTKEERRLLVKFAIDRIIAEEVKELTDYLDAFDRRRKAANG